MPVCDCATRCTSHTPHPQPRQCTNCLARPRAEQTDGVVWHTVPGRVLNAIHSASASLAPLAAYCLLLAASIFYRSILLVGCCTEHQAAPTEQRSEPTPTEKAVAGGELWCSSMQDVLADVPTIGNWCGNGIAVASDVRLINRAPHQPHGFSDRANRAHHATLIITIVI